MISICRYYKLFFLFLFLSLYSFSQVQVGSGAYTNFFPGVDVANRNGFPSGVPQVSGNATTKPIPTNDWWSRLVKENHADNLFNYPMTMKTTNNGLIVTYIPWGPIGDSSPIEVGLQGLSASNTTASDFSDWTVTMNWNDGTRQLEATSGIGMPFVYFEKNTNSIAQIKINSGNVTISSEMIIVENATNGGDFVIYAPTGSTWIKNGTTYTSTLNGKNYWSLAMLPQRTTNVSSVANQYKKYAYVFPTNTEANWSYNESTSRVTTVFTVETDVKEGLETNVLQGLLPHQWANLAANSPMPNGASYNSVRGEIKTLEGNTFTIENTYKGILPTLPNLVHNSDGFSISKLQTKISGIENDALSDWTDSYNEGQVMNRLIQTARIADQLGDTEARDKMVATVKERLEDWLSYESGEVAFLFYYNDTWDTMIGYPSGHGQDSNINDHHFHWGYFIHAAAFMEQFEPDWVNQWGPMVNLLIRDAASSDRNDSLFPFLRNFSPYAGHSWANGFASFPQGNDQESTSESMQFASSLIHWGTITEDDSIRDLGIYIYTTEQTAIEEYWLDVHDRIFDPRHPYSLVSRVWGNSYDNGTFWTADIEASYGIELYPIHGGSLYLAHNKTYAQRLWTEIETKTVVLNNVAHDNLWYDTYWKFLSMIDAQKAINLYNSYENRNLKFGISDAQTYHWLHAMNTLGIVESSITADYPIASAFDNNGDKTYVAHNYSDRSITVNFSDGFQLNVPANSMATNKDLNVAGVISSNKEMANENESVELSLSTVGAEITKVEFYENDVLLGEDTAAPYHFNSSNLGFGVHNFYTKIYVNSDFNLSNVISVQVGDQVPYSGVNHVIPGVIEAGHYDTFEGGNGQNISYLDTSINNQGNFRVTEYVDALSVANEGATVGWISTGEWLEYSVDVQTTGCYDVAIRFASGNNNGGGPFLFKVDGEPVSNAISVSSSGDWNNWSTKTANINLTEGTHILRLEMLSGEFNIGKMTFTYNAQECAQSGANTGLPFNFETTPTTADFNNFDGGTATVIDISSPYNLGNPSTKMAKIVRDGGQSWSGGFLNLNENLDFSANGGYITMKVWTEAPIGTSVQVKLEQQNGSAATYKVATTTVSGAWETLHWDFSQFGSSPYDKLVFMFDIGNVGDGTNTSTFYFDDVAQASTLNTNVFSIADTHIYPNPVENRLTILSNKIQIQKVEIYSILGKKIKEVQKNFTDIAVDDLSSGLYLLKVYAGKGSIVTKVFKQ